MARPWPAGRLRRRSAPRARQLRPDDARRSRPGGRVVQSRQSAGDPFTTGAPKSSGRIATPAKGVSIRPKRSFISDLSRPGKKVVRFCTNRGDVLSIPRDDRSPPPSRQPARPAFDHLRRSPRCCKSQDARDKPGPYPRQDRASWRPQHAIPNREADGVRRLMDFISRSDAVAPDHMTNARTGGRQALTYEGVRCRQFHRHVGAIAPCPDDMTRRLHPAERTKLRQAHLSEHRRQALRSKVSLPAYRPASLSANNATVLA